MVPDIDLQLQAAIKALTDVIGPAVNTDDKMASEQLHLVIATLRMARERLPVRRRFVRRLLEDAIELAETVNAEGARPALAQQISEAREALHDPELEATEIEAIRGRLSAATAQIIADAGVEGLRVFGKDVARGSAVPVARLRAWSTPSGFEPQVDELATLDTLI